MIRTFICLPICMILILGPSFIMYLNTKSIWTLVALPMASVGTYIAVYGDLYYQSRKNSGVFKQYQHKVQKNDGEPISG